MTIFVQPDSADGAHQQVMNYETKADVEIRSQPVGRVINASLFPNNRSTGGWRLRDFSCLPPAGLPLQMKRKNLEGREQSSGFDRAHLEAQQRRPRAAGDELEQLALLVVCEAFHHLPEDLDDWVVGRVPTCRRERQHFWPSLVIVCVCV